MDLDPDLECTVSGALAFALRMSRVAGLAPLKFRKVRAGWRVRVSEGLYLYGKAFVVLLCFTIIVTLMAFMQRKPPWLASPKNRALCYLDVAVAILVALGGACTARARMDGMIKSLHQIQRITMNLNNYRRNTTTQKIQWMIFTAVVFGGCCVLLIDCGIPLSEDMPFLDRAHSGIFFVLYIILEMIETLLTIQFVFIAINICSTFDQLNGCLRDICTKKKFDAKRQQECVHQLLSLHGDACAAAQSVDRCYGFTTLLIICSALVHLLAMLHEFIKRVPTSDFSSSSTLMPIMWCALLLSRVLTIVEPCHRTQEQMERTKVLICKMIVSSSKDNVLEGELKLFASHLTLNDPVYSPLQMFTLNRQFLITVLGTITTYLVITQ